MNLGRLVRRTYRVKGMHTIEEATATGRRNTPILAAIPTASNEAIMPLTPMDPADAANAPMNGVAASSSFPLTDLSPSFRTNKV